MNNSENTIEARLRPYTIKELYVMYEVSYYVIAKWLNSIKDLGDCVSGVYNIRQVQIIFETFGVPGQEITFE